MAIDYYTELIISEANKKDFNIKNIQNNSKELLNANAFLNYLLNDFLDFNLIKNGNFKLSSQ
jgi:hypothetical protein